MEGASPIEAGTPGGAVFLSYASQDAQAAQSICEALRAAGVEVWFDQSELRGGDAWDQSIRKQIKTCALFLPVLSHTTHHRREGYFRLEWKLAVDRSHLMDVDKAFLLPVVIDDTCDDDERVPERFREVQWTRLPDGITPSTFVERVRGLLSGELSQEGTPSAAARVPAAPSTRKPVLSWRSKAVLLATVAVVVVALGYLVANRGLSNRGAEVGAARAPAAQSAPATAFNPPPHSIAVLPFVNMSGDKEQEYFSDGLSEELLNDLARIDQLQVAARTSAFSFKGKDIDIATIARKLNVGTVLEGSVRRSAHTVRVTAQLINAVTGFHMWSQTYDRSLGDVLKLQTSIAEAVASALKVTLLGNLAAKMESGGTRNSAAFDAYLRAAQAQMHGSEEVQGVIAGYTEAIRLDPDYALAFAGRSIAVRTLGDEYSTSPADRLERLESARADAQHAITLAPDLGLAHVALASYFEDVLEFARASDEYGRATALAPGNAEILRNYSWFAVWMGRFDAGIAAARRGVVLDPLNRQSHHFLGVALYFARHYQPAIASFDEALALDPRSVAAPGFRGLSYYQLGNFQGARASCEDRPTYWVVQICLAVTASKLGRRSDADAQLSTLQSSSTDSSYNTAEIYAQWGNTDKALQWLETAIRLRDPGLEFLKTDPLLDPLRNEPRFQAIERELKFPDWPEAGRP